MKLYRIETRLEDGEHGGFTWLGSKRTAVREAARQKKDGFEAEVDIVEFNTGKEGLLHLLNRVAEHPDNG